MNVAVFNLKDIVKYVLKICIATGIIVITTRYVSNSGELLKKTILEQTDSRFLFKCLETAMPIFKPEEQESRKTIKVTSFVQKEIPMLSVKALEKTEVKTEYNEQEQEIIVVETTSPAVEIASIAKTESVSERNFEAGYNLVIGTTKIDNESNYTITEEMINKNIQISNKKDILIYHTHTSESYTPCNTYNYTMTGNYRTTDSNYNVIRVGSELKTYLKKKGFNVIHDGTYHDYPAYSGSYSRSLETAERLIHDTPGDIVIDLHRDAVGNGDTYGPTIMIDGQRVAQLMFVIGTDGGGLEHPDWLSNLSMAIKIQEKANEMYPGLFRPIIIRNSRYNQHVAKGACIIEVGATANELGECLLSMQCLANVLEKTCQ